MKYYIKNLIIRFLPLFIITGVISLTNLLAIVLGDYGSYTTRQIIFDGGGYTMTTAEPAYVILAIFAPLLILSTIAPLFANSYRYKLKSVDTFYQVKEGEKTIRAINSIVFILMLLAIYTASFTLVYFILLIKLSILNGQSFVVEGLNVTRYFYMYNFGFYLLAYFFIVIIVILNYFISSYLVTRSNNLFNSILTLIAGHVALIMVFVTICYYPAVFLSRFGVSNYLDGQWIFGIHSPSPISLFIYICFAYTPLIDTCPIEKIAYMYTLSGTFQITIFIISIITFVTISAYCTYRFFSENTMSGEYAGKPNGRSKMQEFIFHLAFTSIGIWIGPLFFLTYYAFVFGMFITVLSILATFLALYYVLHSVLHRNFRINWKVILSMLPTLIIVLHSILLSLIVASLNY